MVEPPQLFSQPPNTLSNYVLGGSAMYYITAVYITILVELRPSKSLNPPANFSQFKHWINVSLNVVLLLNRLAYYILWPTSLLFL